MKNCLLLINLLLAAGVRAQAPADLRHSGLRLDDDAYRRVAQKPDNVVYKAPLPRQLSYEKYLPAIEQQGDYGTCVAFSCAYYTRTAAEAIQQGLTDQNQINRIRLSPTYLYARLKLPGDAGCQQGGLMDEALTLLKQHGVPRWTTVPYPRCGGSFGTFDREAGRYRIRHFERVFDLMSTSQRITSGQDAQTLRQQNILNVKRALAGGYPVPVAMLVPLSFLAVSGDTWTPGPTDRADLADEIASNFTRQRVFGHAMTVVGYDDARQAFRLVNSWGTRWADKGLCWVKYADFAVFTKYAFRVYPTGQPIGAPATPAKPAIIARTAPAKPTNRPLPRDSRPALVDRNGQSTNEPATMQASVELRLIDGAVMPARRLLSRDSTDDDGASDEIGAYRLRDGYASGTRFKLTVSNDKAAYIYVIGTDQSTRLTRLFPYADSLSAMVDAREAAVLPGPTKHIRLDNNPGQEYFLVLFSDEALDLGALMTEMSVISGSLSQKITQTLGDRLMNWRTMQYDSEQIRFNTRHDATGKVVPLLISLEHKP